MPSSTSSASSPGESLSPDDGSSHHSELPHLPPTSSSSSSSSLSPSSSSHLLPEGFLHSISSATASESSGKTSGLSLQQSPSLD